MAEIKKLLEARDGAVGGFPFRYILATLAPNSPIKLARYLKT